MKFIKKLIFDIKKSWLLLHEHDLWNAIKSGNKKTVEKFIQAGFDFDTQDESGNTALHYACYKRNWEMIELLLTQNINVNIFNQNKKTPLLTISFFCSMPSLAEIDPQANNDLKENTYRIIKKLVSSGANINAQDNRKNTAFIYTCLYDHLPLTKLLLDNQVNLHHRNEDDYDGLMYAISKDNQEIIQTVFSSSLTPEHLEYCRFTVKKMIPQDEYETHSLIKILDKMDNFCALDNTLNVHCEKSGKIRKL